nr:hypothetical protein [Candidatus Sigynarchaeota archaeon]
MIPIPLHEKAVQPCCLANLWGRSGTGKTCLAMNIALGEAMAGKKVLYFTDDPGSIAVKVAPLLHDGGHPDASNKEITNALESIIFVHVHDFKNQNEIIEMLPHAFIPGDDLVNSIQFKNIIAKGEMDLNQRIVDSVRKNYIQPSLVIFDEFTRLYRDQVMEKEDADLSNRMLALQAGSLDSLAREKNVAIIVVSGARTEQVELNTSIEDGRTVSFEDVSAANQIIDKYASVQVRLEHTIVPGERMITIADERDGKKKQASCISMKDIYDLKPGVQH